VLLFFASSNAENSRNRFTKLNNYTISMCMVTPQRADRILIVTGDAPIYREAATATHSYLIGMAQYNPSVITDVQGADLRTDGTKDAIAAFFGACHPLETVVVIYNGHGGTKGISPGPRGNIPYDDITEIIDRGPAHFLWVNSACSAGAIIDPFNNTGLLDQRGSVIASSQANETTYGPVFLARMFASYGERKVYDDKQEVVVERGEDVNGSVGRRIQHPQRGGNIVLDHLLFPL
jgi:hypothetical protein